VTNSKRSSGQVGLGEGQNGLAGVAAGLYNMAN
jgi:hypothetical protein